MINILYNKPSIGMGTTFGTSMVHWLEILNPMLSFVSLCIGITVGIVTLIIQLKKLGEKNGNN